MADKKGMEVNFLDLNAGEYIRILGVVEPDCKWFAFNLGQSIDEIALHFNARFDHLGYVNTIVCNSKDNSGWGAEQQYSDFPFKQGSIVEVTVHYNKDQMRIKLPDEREIQYLNRLGLASCNFLSVENFRVKSIEVN